MFWVFVAQVQVLKVGVPDIEFKLFAPQKEAQELCVFFLFVGLHTRSEDPYQDGFSCLLNVQCSDSS